MLKYFFYGAANLFKGMAIYDENISVGKFVWCPSDPDKHNFPPHPVIHMDFSTLSCMDAEAFERSLVRQLNTIAASQGCSSLDGVLHCGEVFCHVVQQLSAQETNQWGGVVVLIDEYDMPLNSRPAIQMNLTEVYKRLFTAIKASDAHIDYAYVTGITSYGLAGVLSGANNFRNISFSPEFEGFCGFTVEETKELMSRANFSLNEDDFSRFKNKYNGYSWCTDRDFGAADEKATEGKVVTYFNPFLVTCSCQEKTMDVPFWVRTASDSLMKTFPRLRSVDVPVQVPINSLTKVRTPDSIANSVDPEDSARFLLELGYATIKACDRTKMTVTLDYPNEEIRNHMKDELTHHSIR
jgi:hypothetical protein